MVISIRRSRHDEGKKLIAIGVGRSMQRTIFYQKSIERNWRSGERVFTRSAAVGRGDGEDEPVAFMLLTGNIWMRYSLTLRSAAAAWVSC